MAAPFTVLDHPLAGDLLTRLRDRDTGPAEYRALTRRLGLLLVAEATRDLATEPRKVDTPLEPFEGTAVAESASSRSRCCAPGSGCSRR